jgi:multidrug resistance efflux pump
MHDIKAVTTQWVISWIRVKVFHLPGAVQPLSLRRAIGYAGYALLSGFYCYALLLFFVRILYHIVYYYTPQWAFLPAWLLGLRIFRSRILKLGHFMKELYLDKKDLLRAHRKLIFAGALALLALGLLPLRRDKVTERFVLEPVQRAVLRAQVPGRVVEVGADEGQRVATGAALVQLRDLGAQSDAARTTAEYQMAAARALDAQLHYADYGSAEQKRRAAQSADLMARGKQQQLTVTSPIAGVVITPRLHDLLGSYVAEGTELAEVVDASSVRARIFVPEYEMQKLRAIHDVSLRMDSQWGSVTGTVVSISPASQPPDPGLMAAPTYQGIKLPDFFVVTVALANPGGELRDGMTGTAKVYGRRRSFLGVIFEPVLAAAARRLW